MAYCEGEGKRALPPPPYDSYCTHGRVFGPSSLLDLEVIAPCGTSVPCQLRPEVRRHGRGVLWAGGDPCMTGCLEGPLASPVFAQSWSQTATDGAWSSKTALNNFILASLYVM